MDLELTHMNELNAACQAPEPPRPPPPEEPPPPPPQEVGCVHYGRPLTPRGTVAMRVLFKQTRKPFAFMALSVLLLFGNHILSGEQKERFTHVVCTLAGAGAAAAAAAAQNAAAAAGMA